MQIDETGLCSEENAGFTILVYIAEYTPRFNCAQQTQPALTLAV